MKPLYAISFFLKHDKLSPEEIYVQAKVEVENWIKNRCKRWDLVPAFNYNGTNGVSIPGHSVISDEKSQPPQKLMEVVWQHPDSREKMSWRANVKVAKDDKSVWFSLHLALIMDVVSPAKFNLGIPQIARALVSKFNCVLGNDAVTDEYAPLSAEFVDSFVSGILLSPGRYLPVVVVSKDMAGESPIDPHLLAVKCTGVAKVYLLEDKWASWKLSELLGDKMSCYNGAVRIYWPKMRTEDSPFRHHLYLKNQIAAINSHPGQFEEELSQKLSQLSLIMDHSSFGRGIENAIDRAKLTVLQEEHKSGKLKADQLFRLASEQSEKIAAAEQRTRQLQEQLDDSELRALEAEEKISQINEELAAVKKSFAQCQPAQPDFEVARVVSPEEDSHIDSVFDAVKLAQKRFVATLVFHEKAVESAKEAIYMGPKRVYQLFEALNDICAKWQQDGKLGDTWKNILDKKGFEFKQNISAITKGKYGEEYYRMYKGQRVSLHEHITISKGGPETCISVHLWRDPESRQLLIGHCGRHLTNTQT